MFHKYKRLPNTVEAVQFTEANKNKIFDSLIGQSAAGLEDGKLVLKVTNIYGDTVTVRTGDWIVKEPKLGRYYPVKDEIFRKGYGPVANEAWNGTEAISNEAWNGSEAIANEAERKN
jgi:hypothetical protein